MPVIKSLWLAVGWAGVMWFALEFCIGPVDAYASTTTVLSIGDGDTLRVQALGRTITVRLACIDAPEMAQSPWGQKARQHLQALAPIGSAVELRGVGVWSTPAGISRPWQFRRHQ